MEHCRSFYLLLKLVSKRNALASKAMEAYKLFANSVIKKIGSQKVAIIIGLAHSVVFGIIFIILGHIAVHEKLGYNRWLGEEHR